MVNFSDRTRTGAFMAVWSVARDILADHAYIQCRKSSDMGVLWNTAFFNKLKMYFVFFCIFWDQVVEYFTMSGGQTFGWLPKIWPYFYRIISVVVWPVASGKPGRDTSPCWWFKLACPERETDLGHQIYGDACHWRPFCYAEGQARFWGVLKHF